YESRLAAANVSAESRPGNITEPSALGSELAGKRLQLLREIVPGLARLAVLSNPSNPSHTQALEQMQTAAQSLAVELHFPRPSAPYIFECVFARVIAGRSVSLIFLAEGIFINNPPRILAFTDFNPLPALFPKKEIAGAGGLMPYGPSVPASRGDNATDLPIE